MGVAIGAFYLKYALAQFQHRDIKGAAAKVEYGDLHIVRLFIKAIGQCRSRRLVYDTSYRQTCDLAGFLGRLPLGVVEISGNGDHGFLHFLPQVVFRGFLHFLKYHSGNFLGGI